MSQRVIDYDPITGMSTTFNYDHTSDTYSVGWHQDPTAIWEANKRTLIEADHSKQMKEDVIHYARVPISIQYEWLAKYGVDFGNKDHTKAWMKLLNSPEYSGWKVSPIHHDR